MTQLWVHRKSAIIGNKLGLIDVRPTGAALGLVDNGFAQFANSGGNSLLPVVEGDTEWKGWQAIVEADGNLPVNISLDPPEITGRTNIGETLTCDAGTWIGTQPITFQYRWLSNNTPIIGETANTYVIRIEDSSAEIVCAVKATNSVGSSIEFSNTIQVLGARYTYVVTSNQFPPLGFAHCPNGGQMLRINGTDLDFIDHAAQIRTLKAGDVVIFGTYRMTLADIPIENSGVFSIPITAPMALAAGDYIVTVEISASN